MAWEAAGIAARSAFDRQRANASVIRWRNGGLNSPVTRSVGARIAAAFAQPKGAKYASGAGSTCAAAAATASGPNNVGSGGFPRTSARTRLDVGEVDPVHVNHFRLQRAPGTTPHWGRMFWLAWKTLAGS